MGDQVTELAEDHWRLNKTIPACVICGITDVWHRLKSGVLQVENLMQLHVDFIYLLIGFKAQPNSSIIHSIFQFVV